jgi:Dual specificity phosphatase, catalytic domain
VVTPRNFASASLRDHIVFGADRPGYELEQVNEWIEFMLERGIRRVVCVLAGEKLAKYDDLLGAYRRCFSVVTHAPIDNYGLPTDEVLERALTAFAEAERAGEPVLVHCAAGMGRTGLLSTAWLCRRYGLDVDEAIAEVCESAWRVGANRDPLEAGPDSRRVLARARGLGPAA